MSDIQAGNLRLISQELLDKIDQAFRPPEITAASTEAEIKWAAAQRAVVDYIFATVGKKQTIGTPSQEPGRVMPSGAYVRLGQ